MKRRRATLRKGDKTPPYAAFRSIVRGRRSIRKFSGQALQDKTLRALLDVVRYAPSSLNGQPAHIRVIQDTETKRRIASFKNKWCPPKKREYPADFLAAAPALLIVSVKNQESHDRWIENGVIISTYILLAASALGLGSTLLTAFNLKRPRQAREFKKLLHIPEHLTPVTILPVGYPAEKPKQKRVRALREIIQI